MAKDNFFAGHYFRQLMFSYIHFTTSFYSPIRFYSFNTLDEKGTMFLLDEPHFSNYCF